jgi:hypothetical protein
MIGTIPRTRVKPRPKALVSMIREVCLIGSPTRNYAHFTPQGLRNEDERRGSRRDIDK